MLEITGDSTGTTSTTSSYLLTYSVVGVNEITADFIKPSRRQAKQRVAEGKNSLAWYAWYIDAMIKRLTMLV